MSAPGQRNRKNPIGFTQRPEPGEAAEIARSRLQSNPYLALKTVSCDFREGKLTLRGNLPSYFLKQMAQSVIGTVEGVEQIVNQIEVVPRTSGGDHSTYPHGLQPVGLTFLVVKGAGAW